MFIGGEIECQDCGPRLFLEIWYKVFAIRSQIPISVCSRRTAKLLPSLARMLQVFKASAHPDIRCCYNVIHR